METNEGALLGWQPIETAPKGCNYVLVWDTKYDRPVIARTDNTGNPWEGGLDEVKASHWMPLQGPAPRPTVTTLTEFDQ